MNVLIIGAIKKIAVRTQTLIKFLFNTAFRIEEALGILTSDLYKENGYYFVRIHEKGKAKGVLTEITISKNTFDLLNNYLSIKKVPSDFIFSSTRSSSNGKAKQFSRRQFNNNNLRYYQMI